MKQVKTCLPQLCYVHYVDVSSYGSGHEGAAVLLPGFAKGIVKLWQCKNNNIQNNGKDHSNMNDDMVTIQTGIEIMCITKATITHWRFWLENRCDTAKLRTAEERHKIWRLCFHFHGITVVVHRDTLSCAHVQQQCDQDWSSGGSVAALVRKPHALSRLHDARSRFAAFGGAQTRCTHVRWCSSALRHHHSRSLAEARHFLALTHD